jgi:hypothetical protein
MCVCFCSDDSLDHSSSIARLDHTSEMHGRVTARDQQLMEDQRILMTELPSAMPLFEAFLGRGDDTRALLVCRVLVPRATRHTYTTADSRTKEVSAMTYGTKVSAQVCPHFLVLVSELTV